MKFDKFGFYIQYLAWSASIPAANCDSRFSYFFCNSFRLSTRVTSIVSLECRMLMIFNNNNNSNKNSNLKICWPNKRVEFDCFQVEQPQSEVCWFLRWAECIALWTQASLGRRPWVVVERYSTLLSNKTCPFLFRPETQLVKNFSTVCSIIILKQPNKNSYLIILFNVNIVVVSNTFKLVHRRVSLLNDVQIFVT